MLFSLFGKIFKTTLGMFSMPSVEKGVREKKREKEEGRVLHFTPFTIL